MGRFGIGGLVFGEKILDREFAEIRQCSPQRFVIPVPPRKLRKPADDILGKPALDRSRRIARDDGVGRNILGDDGAGGDHRAGADAAAGQHDGAVPDPDIMTDMNAMTASPFEELGLVALAVKIGAGTVGECACVARCIG